MLKSHPRMTFERNDINQCSRAFHLNAKFEIKISITTQQIKANTLDSNILNFSSFIKYSVLAPIKENLVM